MDIHRYHKFEFCKRNGYTHTEKRCTEDRSDWFILVVFRSTRRNDRTKQLLRFDLSPPVDPIEFSRMTKHQFREPVVQRFYSRWNEQNSRISRRIFEERCGSKVKLERRLPFLPSSTIDGGSIRAFRRSNQVTRCNLCKKIYAWTVRILVRRVTGRRD